ncbi:unnamed protein product [Diamesa hyperborea]
MSTPSRNSVVKIPISILDDLSSKFLINLPEEEKNDLIRLFFQIELAHWFFLDFHCTQEESIQPCGIKQFALNIFQHIPSFNKHCANLELILEEWRVYKSSVPTYGAILLSEDLKHVLLVQSFFTKNSWGFPKGKVNEHEEEYKCAIREVYEETGFDSSHLINPKEFIESNSINFQYTKLYIVKDVPLDTKFAPKTRNEIKECSWFVVDELPTNRNDECYMKDNRKIRANSFYMIIPFIKHLKKWINDLKQSKNYQTRKQRNKSTGDKTDIRNSPSINNKNQQLPFTSTPINNQTTFTPSSSSAFRVTNSEINKVSNSCKKKSQQQQQVQHLNSSKTNGTTINNISNMTNKSNAQLVPTYHTPKQENIKRKLFPEQTKENIRPLTVAAIKPFPDEFVPECWKNFKFDHQKLINSMYN